MNPPLVIVGSGLAGYQLAREFRKHDPATSLIMISQDHAGFYSKPMLSNALAGQKTAASLVMKSSDKMAAELNVVIRAHTRVDRIDAAAHQLMLADGSTLAYGQLALALGADPHRLALAGDGAHDAISVNDLDDYTRFSQRLSCAKSVLIMGAGLIGCEFANDLVTRQITPIVVDPAPQPLPLLLPPSLGNKLQQKLETAGVRFALGTHVERIMHASPGFAVTLSDGQTLIVDVVLSAVGLRPRSTLAEQAGLEVNAGITVDRYLATTAASIYALGDCARVQGHALPYVLPLMQQARALAATLAGQPTPVRYPAMPITLKTPACPTVICPPMHTGGTWEISTTDHGASAHCKNAQGTLLGFALMGNAVSQRQTLALQIPDWL